MPEGMPCSFGRKSVTPHRSPLPDAGQADGKTKPATNPVDSSPLLHLHEDAALKGRLYMADTVFNANPFNS
jgi:hypothetical protein